MSSTKKAKAATRIHGQRQIESTRATEIQQALIKQNYLTGEPSGLWDQQTEAAMQKFQADNGWQTKLMPDSRALIKLGLGPNAAAALPEQRGSQSYLPSSSAPPAAGNSLFSSHTLPQ